MADATNVDASKVEETKVDATPAAEDKKADATPAAETAQADQAAPVEAPAVPEPSSNATATEEKATAADPPKEEAAGSAESATAAPAAAEAKADEAKPAEEAKEAAKGEGETETKPAAEEASATKEKDSAAAATKEAAPKKSAFEEFDAKVPDILKEIDHDEMWGVKLVTPAASHIPTQIVVQKFLNANDGDLVKAVDQFKGALKFRKEKKPLELIKKTFNANKFAELGAVTVYPAKDSSVPEVFTWNLYGNVKGKIDEAFTPLDEYVQLRIA